MKKCLVLDIDETLLHSTYERLKVPEDAKLGERNVYFRPHWKPFLEFCFAHFEVGVWTASNGDYADFVFQKMGYRDQLKFLYHREHCMEREVSTGFITDIRYIKDLQSITDYPLENIIMLDDTPQYVDPSDNVLMIDEFRGEPDDSKLLDMMEELRKRC